MKRVMIIISLVLFTWMGGSAQTIQPSGGLKPDQVYTFSWKTMFTLGDFHDWVGSASPAGFDFAGRYFITDGFNAGFNLGWQRIYQAYGYET